MTSDTAKPSTFWLFWAAGAAGTTGGGITAVALPLLAITVLNASNFEAGLLTAAGYAAVVLVGLPAGVLVQHFPLRGLQVTMDVLRAAAVLTIPLAAWWDALTLAQVLLVAFFVGLASSLFDVANVTYLPQIVPPSQLIARNGLISGTDAATGLLGPSLGGLLVQALGAAASVLANAATYLVSAVLLSRLPVTPKQDVPSDEPGFFPQIWTGLRFVFDHPVIRPAVIAASAVNFANGAIAAVTAPFLVRSLDLPVGAVGAMLALDGLGSIIGAALAARLVRRYGDARAMIAGALTGAVVALAMPLAYAAVAPLLFGLGLCVFGGGVAILSVVARTHRQTVSPPELLSRVMASVRFVSWSAIPIGALAAGALAQLIAPRAGLALACAAALLAPAVLWSSRIRRLHNLTDAESGPVVPAGT